MMQDYQTFIDMGDYLYRSSSSLLHGSLQSTLWISSSGETSISSIIINETEVDLILRIDVSDLHLFKLDLTISPETVLIQGQPIEATIVEGYFCPNGFESLIPLPHVVKPETYWAEIKENTVILQITKELNILRSEVQIQLVNPSHTPIRI